MTAWQYIYKPDLFLHTELNGRFACKINISRNSLTILPRHNKLYSYEYKVQTI